MTISAAALRLMAEKGLSALDIAEIAEAIEASTPKSSGAERQKRYRDRLRNERNERDVTSDVTTPLPSPSPSFPPDPQTNPTPAHPRDGIPRARKADDFPKPEWADPQVWADFMTNRKAKKARNTVTAYRGFLSDIDKHTSPDWPPGRLLEHAAAKGWAGIYEPDKQDRNHGSGSRPVQQSPDGRSMGRTESAAREALARLSGGGNRGAGSQVGPSIAGGNHGGTLALPDPDRPHRHVAGR